MSISIIYFGSSEYSLYALNALYLKRFNILAVVTAPDKPVGRKQEISPTEVKKWAKKHRVPVLTPRNKKELEVKISRFCKDCEVDFFVVCVYKMMLSKKVLELSKYGSLNIHPSILPKYRGSSPVQEAIANGDRKTGVSIILMDEKMDHGPIVGRIGQIIKIDDTADILYKKLFEKGADLLIKVMCGIIKGLITPLPQDDSRATYTKILTREDGKIDWKWSDEKIERFIRAMGKWPGTWTEVKMSGGNKHKRLKILKAHTKGDKLVFDRVQLEGKQPVSWKQFFEGYSKAQIVKK